MTIPVEFSAADIRVEMAPPFNVDVSVNGPPGPKGEPGQDGADGTSGSSGFIAQPEPPADTSVLWLDTDEDPSGSGFLPSGGAAGQVLTKDTGTDFDASWSDPSGGGAPGAHTHSIGDLPSTLATDAEVAAAIAAIPAGSGSTILSGTATPTGAVGAVGDYYLDSDDLVLYGPKNAAPVYATPTPAHGALTPASTSSAGTNVAEGMRFSVQTAGRITQLRFWRESSSITSRKVILWTDAGVKVAEVTTSGETGTGWVTVTLGTPVDVLPGEMYRVARDRTTGSMGYSPATPTSAVAGITFMQAVYVATLATFPTTLQATTDYFADVVYGALTAPVWPVALKSIPPGGSTGQVLGKTTATDYDAAWAAGGGGGGAADSDQNIIANQVFG